MVEIGQVISGVQELFTSTGGTDFLIWLVAVPIAFMVIVTLIVMKSWENPPEFTHQLWFKIVYMVGLYAIAVIIISLVFSFIR